MRVSALETLFTGEELEKQLQTRLLTEEVQKKWIN